jgi:hypothetical protein
MYLFRTLLTGCILTAALASCESEPLPSADPSTTLIDNVTVIDGSGSPRNKGSVRILAGEIIAVGDLEKLPGEVVIDGGGQVLAPGFIDTHSHADEELFDRPGALAAVSQGITTVVIGQDGQSPFPLLDFRFRLLDNPVAVNIAAFSGHNTIRQHVMRDDYQRHASAPETRVMAQFLREDMQAGALGLSTGLEYDPGIYSSFDELAALATIAAEQGGRYISHLRSEDHRLEEAIEEIIEIGRQVDIPVQISHFKLAMMPLWGRAAEIIQTLNEARSEGVEISADISQRHAPARSGCFSTRARALCTRNGVDVAGRRRPQDDRPGSTAYGLQKAWCDPPGRCRRPGVVRPGDDYRQRDAAGAGPAQHGYQQGLGQWLAGVRRGFRNRPATGALYWPSARLNGLPPVAIGHERRSLY